MLVGYVRTLRIVYDLSEPSNSYGLCILLPKSALAASLQRALSSVRRRGSRFIISRPVFRTNVAGIFKIRAATCRVWGSFALAGFGG